MPAESPHAPQTILITGGCGFIGSGFVQRCVGAGHRVVIADYLHPQVHPDASAVDSLPDGVEHHPIDVTDAPAMDAIVRATHPDTVVHLAAETGTGQSLTESSRHGRVNVVGTTNLLDACTRADHIPERIVLTSSRAVYGEGAWRDEDDRSVFYPPQRSPLDLAGGRWDPPAPSGGGATPLANRAGHTEPRPTNIYAATKLAQEHLIMAWCTAMQSSARLLRLQNVYGPGQSPSNSYTGVLTYFAVRANAGETIAIYEDGDIGRDFVFVDDVVDELMAATTATGNDLCDVGSGVRSTIEQAAQIIAIAAGAPTPEITGEYRLGDVRSAWADGVPARQRTPLEVGLRRLVEHLSQR
jgi:dTDP-L-rhamnose 4-epimerase